MLKPKNIILLGSTGSIGTAAFKIAERYPDRFRLIALACGQNANAILPQIRKFKPLLVSVKDDETRELLKDLLSKDRHIPTILTGEAGLLEVASAKGGDLLVNGLVGFVGVKPTILALKRGLDFSMPYGS
jgi:1-deoxy-D-xylulose-5-phosphate reductoisomerase